jgi:ATP-binding cassette subfamily F protein uup
MTDILWIVLSDHLFVFEGDGVIKDFPGNYSQYRESTANGQRSTERISEKKHPVMDGVPSTVDKKRQLTFKEKREFETLEKEIAELTKEKELVDLRLNSSDTHLKNYKSFQTALGK